MDEDLATRIAERVNAFEASLSGESFSVRVGIDPEVFGAMMAGSRGISSLELLHIADGLGVDVTELVTGVPDPHRMVVTSRCTCSV